MLAVNVSKARANYSQRNNEVKPLESCNVTSMCMALDYMGYSFPEGKYTQPEDNLREFIEAKGWSPEVHDQLSQGANEWIGRRAAFFSTGILINEVISEIIASRPVVMSGTFPGYPKPRLEPLNHVVCLVGFEWEGNNYNETPTCAVVDDPYGNTMDNWRGNGNDVKIPWGLFVSWMKPQKDTRAKWGHLFYQV
jgi:hypothetical protein